MYVKFEVFLFGLVAKKVDCLVPITVDGLVSIHGLESLACSHFDGPFKCEPVKLPRSSHGHEMDTKGKQNSASCLYFYLYLSHQVFFKISDNVLPHRIDYTLSP